MRGEVFQWITIDVLMLAEYGCSDPDHTSERGFDRL